MSGDELKPKSAKHSLAAYTRWANTSPEERRRIMTERSKLAAAKRAAERAERIAAGEPVKPKRRTRSDDALPPIEDLVDEIALIQKERVRDGLPALSADAAIREAAFRIRSTIARATVDAMRKTEGKP